MVGNEIGVLNGATYQIPTDDKQLVDTPEYTFAGRVQYDFGPASLGLQSKYTSYRYTTDINDDKTPGFAVWDFDARYNLNLFGYTGSYIQVNVSNIFDRYYLGRISTAVNAHGYAGVNGAQIASPSSTAGPYFYIGAPALRDGHPSRRLLTSEGSPSLQPRAALGPPFPLASAP